MSIAYETMRDAAKEVMAELVIEGTDGVADGCQFGLVTADRVIEYMKRFGNDEPDVMKYIVAQLQAMIPMELRPQVTMMLVSIAVAYRKAQAAPAIDELERLFKSS